MDHLHLVDDEVSGDPSEIRVETDLGHVAVVSAEFPGFDGRRFVVAVEPNPPGGYVLYADWESAVIDAIRREGRIRRERRS